MKNDRHISFIRILVVALFVLSTVFAKAQETATFLGSINSLWSNPGNWANGMKPNENVIYVAINTDVVVDEDVTIQNLFDAAPCTLTIQSGKKMTVLASITWSGGDFILEDAAQLLTDNPQILTVKKSITAQADCQDPWYTIASPLTTEVMPSFENGFLTDPETGYALYSFSEATLQFVDFKETPFPLVNGKGYLYANALDTTLLFSGTVYGSNVPIEVPLDYHSVIGTVTGCNLVGNPFPCNAYSNRSYYLISGPDNILLPVTASSARALKPCEGVFVKADAADETITFSRIPESQSVQDQGYIIISASKANVADTLGDQAVISFNPNDDLGKYIINTDLPRVSFTKNDRDMAIISIDSADALSVKFKATKSGTYTLRFQLKDLEINYLHLIDNINGTNTDLLTTPYYTFTANPNDYATRFKLVFEPHYDVEELEHQSFAYYAMGEIHLVSDTPEASLQVYDMAGRFVRDNRNGACTISTAGMAPGVYVLRLSTPSGAWTQKITIE